MNPSDNPSGPETLNLFLYDNRLPVDLKDRLKAFVPRPRSVVIHWEDEVPATVKVKNKVYDFKQNKYKTERHEVPLKELHTEYAAIKDLATVLRLTDSGKIKVSAKTKRVSAAGAKLIAEILYGGDYYELEDDIGYIKAFAWPLILQSAGLANSEGTKLKVTNAGTKALRSSPHTVLKRAWNRWLKNTILDEFNRINTICGQRGKGKRSMSSAAGRRAFIAEALRLCPQNKWILFDEFSRFIRASGKTFQVTRDPWSLYIGDPNYGSLGWEGFGEWNILEERYILAFLFEYAATMGIIDVAYAHPIFIRNDFRDLWGVDDLDFLSRYDGLCYFRINGLGAYCLELVDKYRPPAIEARKALKILPNMDVVATEKLPANDIFCLESFSDKISEMVWKLNGNKLLKSMEKGNTVSDIVKFLKTKSKNELPHNVTVFFDRIGEKASYLKNLGPAILIEANSTELAHLIARHKSLRSFCRIADDRYIVVPSDSERDFRKVLLELGYFLPGP